MRLRTLEEDGGPRLYAKCEFLGPTNSIFDRISVALLQEAQAEGRLEEGDLIAAAGGTDAVISLAMAAAGSGNPLLLLVPDKLHPERRQILHDYNARLILVDADLPQSELQTRLVTEAIGLAGELGAGRVLMLDPFAAPEAAKAYEAIGEELVEALERAPDLVVCGLDLGAIPSGIARGLRKSAENTAQVVAVEPENARIGSAQTFGPHLLGGLAPGPKPSRLDPALIDGFEAVSDQEAWECSEMLTRKTGILAGIASGAVLAAALRRAKTLGPEHSLVAVLPDSGERRFMLADLFA